MKPDIHPNYRPVVFKDNSADFAILTRSTVETKETITWTDGKEYPLVRVDISSQSHPFYTANRTLWIPLAALTASNANMARKAKRHPKEKARIMRAFSLGCFV